MCHADLNPFLPNLSLASNKRLLGFLQKISIIWEIISKYRNYLTKLGQRS